MRKLKPKPETSSSADSGPVTKENYEKRAMAHGVANNSWFMLRRHAKDGKPATHAQWRAWLAWRQEHELPTAWMLAAEVYQVPTEWPEDFDPNADPSDRTWRYPPEDTVGPVERERVLAGLQRLARRMEPAPDPRRANNRTQQTPEEILADLAAYNKRTPMPALSDATLAAMGRAPKVSAPTLSDTAHPDYEDRVDF